MIKKLLLILILAIGCSRTPNNNITGSEISEQPDPEITTPHHHGHGHEHGHDNGHRGKGHSKGHSDTDSLHSTHVTCEVVVSED